MTAIKERACAYLTYYLADNNLSESSTLTPLDTVLLTSVQIILGPSQGGFLIALNYGLLLPLSAVAPFTNMV